VSARPGGRRPSAVAAPARLVPRRPAGRVPAGQTHAGSPPPPRCARASASEPADQLTMAQRAGRDGPLVELPTGLIDRDNGVGVVVRIDAPQHHAGGLLRLLGTSGRPAGMPQLGRCHAPLKPRRSAHDTAVAAQPRHATSTSLGQRVWGASHDRAVVHHLGRWLTHPHTEACLKVSCPTVRPTALAWRPRPGEGLQSPRHCSPRPVRSRECSRCGAHEPARVPTLRVGFVNGMPYQ
jgi:hypothetical protein